MNMGDGIRVPAVDDGRDDPMGPERQIAALRLENAVTGAVAVVKAGGPSLDPCGPTNREKTRVVERIGGGFGLEAALDAVTPGRGTCYHQRAAMRAGDEHAVLRERIRGLFEQGGRVRGHRTIQRLLRMDDAEPLVVPEKVVRCTMGEEGLRPVHLRKPKAVELLRGRAVRGAVQPRGARLPRRAAEHAVAHGRRPVHHGRLQVPAVTGHRPPRRHGRGLAAVAKPRRGHERGHAARRGRHASRRGASHHSLGPRVPLPAVRMDPHLRGARADPVHGRQGLQPGRRGRRGILRQAQERVLPLPRLEGRGVPGIPRTARRLPDPLR